MPQKKNDEAFAKADPGRAPQPFYVGDDVKIEGTSLGPDGRWLLVFTSPKGYDKGKIGKLQHFVTESGYEDQEDERTRVGRNDPAPQSILLLDLATHEQYKLAAGDLPGIHDDPLKAVREENAESREERGGHDREGRRRSAQEGRQEGCKRRQAQGARDPHRLPRRGRRRRRRRVERRRPLAGDPDPRDRQQGPLDRDGRFRRAQARQLSIA